MAVMSGSDTGEFRATRVDIRSKLNHTNGLIVMDGALPIRACAAAAAAALQKVEERLEFAM